MLSISSAREQCVLELELADLWLCYLKAFTPQEP